MKPTFRPAVYAHHKRKDGTFNVKICVYFKGRERRLSTTIYCTKEHLTRTYHIKSQDILNKVNKLIERMYGAISDISMYDLEDRDVDWIVARIKARLTAQTFRLDFFAFAEEYIAGMNDGTRRTYHSALNAFARYLKKRTIDINDITKKMIVGFVDYVDNEPMVRMDRHRGEMIVSKTAKKKGLTSSVYTSRLGAIFKAAKRKYNDEDEEMVLIPRSPFDNLELNKPDSDGEKPLSMELVQMLISADVEKPNHRYAIDCVVVSFGLMGMNLADMFEARPPKDGLLIYNRCKTRERRADNAEMRVEIPAELHPYLERLGAGTDAQVWLPSLRSMSKDRKLVTARVNRGIKSWCEANDLEPFTTYALRKTWATLARKFEDKAIADEAIAHTGGSRMLDIYAEKPWERYHDLNRKVLALFDWEIRKSAKSAISTGAESAETADIAEI